MGHWMLPHFLAPHALALAAILAGSFGAPARLGDLGASPRATRVERAPAPPAAAPAGEDGELERAESARGLTVDWREEHGQGRVVAEIEVELLALPGGGHELCITPSAIGPRIDPIPGWRGIRGANLHTMKEMTSLQAQQRIGMRVSSLDGGAQRMGRVEVARHGRVPERRMRADGRIDHFGASSARGALALSARSGALGDGRWRGELVVDGHVRFAVELELDGTNARILRTGGGGAPAPEVRP